MIPIYLIWLAGILSGLLFVTQIGLLVYKIYKKQEKFAINIILAIVFIFISIACTSTAILIGIKKVADTDISYEKQVKQSVKLQQISLQMHTKALKKHGTK